MTFSQEDTLLMLRQQEKEEIEKRQKDNAERKEDKQKVKNSGESRRKNEYRQRIVFTKK